MAEKPTYEELEQRVKEFEKETVENKAVQQALQLSEQRLSLIYDSVADILYYIRVEPDDCFRFLSINHAFLKATGLTRDQIVGKRIEEVIPETSVRLVLDNYKKAINEHRIVRWEETSVYPAGEKIGDVSIAPVLNEKGICTHLVGSVRDVTERKQAEEVLLNCQEDFRNLAGKLLLAQESERRRLAREMHDDLTQRLAVLAIDIGQMERKFQDLEDPVLEALRSIRERLVNLSGDVHAISRQLHPSILEDLGLVDAIKSECRTFTRREGIAVDYQAEDIPLRITQDVAISIYRIVQEGLRNVAKHADTKQLQISLTGKDDSIHLTIKDQGAGFDLKEAEKKQRLGLVSMQERVRLIQGNISIESQPGKGTVINVRAPVGP